MFGGKEHAPISWDGGAPAALLLHGFPGTPAECRPLAEALHATGWSIRAPLLPGFGTDLASLLDRSYHDWVEAAALSLEMLLRDRAPVILVGHSMGAAIAAVIAGRYASAAAALKGVVMVSPFTQLPNESLWTRVVRRGLRPFVKSIRPFRLLKLDDPSVIAGAREFAPTLDLRDPATRAQIENAAVPLSLFDQLADLGRSASRSVSDIRIPTLVLQGISDSLVPARTTRRLVARLAGRLNYQEFAGGHDLLIDNRPAWPHVRETILGFAAQIRNEQP